MEGYSGLITSVKKAQGYFLVYRAYVTENVASPLSPNKDCTWESC